MIKKILFLFLLITILTVVCFSDAPIPPLKIIGKKCVCMPYEVDKGICYLYNKYEQQNWMLIPIVDKEGNMIKCLPGEEYK